jgi:hypothetical protein
MEKINRNLKKEIESLRAQLQRNSVNEGDLIKGLKLEIKNLSRDKDSLREKLLK